MPHAPFRYVLNTILYVLITGCRWCDVPNGSTWAWKSAAHHWLKRWQTDGTLAELENRTLGIADIQAQIDWEFSAVDGCFSAGKGGGEGVAHGNKGKGVLIHTLTDANGMPLSNRTTPANGDEWAQVIPLLDEHQKQENQGALTSILTLLLLIKDMTLKNWEQIFLVVE